MRALALTYVTGMTPRPEYSAVCFNLIPTVGEYFVFPALTTTGECEIMVFEGVPGGPMDCWADVSTPDAHLATLEHAAGDAAARSGLDLGPESAVVFGGDIGADVVAVRAEHERVVRARQVRRPVCLAADVGVAVHRVDPVDRGDQERRHR